MNETLLSALGRAEAAFDSGDHAAAAVAYRRCLEFLPDDLSILHNIALASHLSGASMDAIEAYRAVLRLDPRQIDSIKNLVELLGRTGAGEGAAAHYDDWIAAAPNDPEAHLAKGYALITYDKDHDGAGLCFERAAALLPDDVRPRISLISALQAAGRHGEAVAVARTLPPATELLSGRISRLPPY